MMSLEEKVAELVERTEETVKLFYQEKQAEGYQRFNEVLESILELTAHLESENEQEENRNLAEKIKGVVQEAFAAVEKKDSRGLADILQKNILGISGEERTELVFGDYYEENIVALQRYSDEVCKRYLKWEKEKKESEFWVGSEGAEDGSIILKLHRGAENWWLNSPCCPQKEAKAWGENLQLQNLNQVVLFFGLGNGMMVQQLWEKGCQDMKLIVYEPSMEIFHYLMHQTRLSDIFMKKDTILLVKGLNEELLYGILDTLLKWDNMSSLQVFSHPVYNQIFKEEYAAYVGQAQEGLIRAKERNNTTKYFGKDIVRNVATCFQFLKKAQYLEQYEGHFAPEIPAIIVAAGPSLDLNIEILKKAKGKAVILATDTAMRDLVKHRIEPDFIITIDPRKPAEYLADAVCQEIPLICWDAANRKILENHRGIKIFYSIHPYFKGVKPEKIPGGEECGSGGSVATAAFSSCVQLGFKTIIMIGQDLAYRNGVSHAGGRMSGEETHGDWLVEVEDIHGNIIKTRHEWYNFLKWFEDAIALVGKNITVIDATEGGAKIHGSKIMPLEEAIETYCTSSIDCSKLVSEVPFAFDEEAYQKAIEYVEQSINDNEKIYDDTRELIVKTKELISFCEKKKYDKKYNRLVKDISRLGERIMKRPIQEWLDFWIAEEEENLQDVYSLEEGSEIQSYNAALKVYENLNRATREIKPILVEVCQRMKENL